jgi:hypothetical protein
MTNSIATKKPGTPAKGADTGLAGGISKRLDAVRRASARTVNVFMTAAQWGMWQRLAKFDRGLKNNRGRVRRCWPDRPMLSVIFDSCFQVFL